MVRLGLVQCDRLDPPHVDIDGDAGVLFTDLLSRPDVEPWIGPRSRETVHDPIGWIDQLRRIVEPARR